MIAGLEGATIRAKFRVSKAARESVRPEVRNEPERRRRSRAERLASQVALTHWIERAIEAGQARNYADVARALGLTPRITQIAGLLRPSPALQEGVLLGGIDLGGRGALRAAGWWSGRSRRCGPRPPARCKVAGDQLASGVIGWQVSRAGAAEVALSYKLTYWKDPAQPDPEGEAWLVHRVAVEP